MLQKKFNVLAITLPSHGDSELKLSKMGSTLDVVVGEITQVLDERGYSELFLWAYHLELYLSNIWR